MFSRRSPREELMPTITDRITAVRVADRREMEVFSPPTRHLLEMGYTARQLQPGQVFRKLISYLRKGVQHFLFMLQMMPHRISRQFLRVVADLMPPSVQNAHDAGPPSSLPEEITGPDAKPLFRFGETQSSGGM